MYDFENFGGIQINPPLSIRSLVTLALESSESGWNIEDGPITELAETVCDILVSKSAILKEYYNFHITDDAMLTQLPLLLGWLYNIIVIYLN